MTVIVTDSGFAPDTWQAGFRDLAELGTDQASGIALDLDVEQDVTALAPHFDRLSMIRISFDSFADGRGFSVAKRLRLIGYQGRLRAVGHVLADQYQNARRSGFDEVEIDADLAERQPEDQWLARANWREHDYRARLRRAV